MLRETALKKKEDKVHRRQTMLITDQNSHWIFAVRRIHGLQIPHTNSDHNAPFNVYFFFRANSRTRYCEMVKRPEVVVKGDARS